MPGRLCVVCARQATTGYRCAEHQLPKRLGGNQKQKVDAQVISRDGNRCTWTDLDGNRCQATSGLQVDHVIPRTAGGTNALSNLTTLCREHHAEKTRGRA